MKYNQDTKQTDKEKRVFNILEKMSVPVSVFLLFIFVLIASFLLITYFNNKGGFDIFELWRSFYAAF